MKKLFTVLICALILLAACTALAATVSGNQVIMGENRVEIAAGDTVKCLFIPEKSGRYTFETTGTMDTYGYLYSESGTVLKQDDNSGSGNNFSMTYNLYAGTSYYVGVKYYSRSKSGTETLNITRSWWWEVSDEGVLSINAEVPGITYSDSPWSVCKDSITSVVIGEGIYEVSYNAFMGCVNLTGISFPQGITAIGANAFKGCSSLTELVIPEGVTSIGANAFQNCGSLEKIYIPDSVTSIGNSAFYNCGSLKSIVIPQGVTTIERDMFINCAKLTSVSIPSGVTSIGRSAFENCAALNDITIPDSVTSIGTQAFCGCESLANLIIPDSVTSIALDSMFLYCGKLTGITLPDSLTAIGVTAFYDCVSLAEIDIPASVAAIRNNAFMGCENLKNVTVRGENVTFGTGVFPAQFINSEASELRCCRGSTADAWAADNGFMGRVIYLDEGEEPEEPHTHPGTGHTDDDIDDICDVCGESLRVFHLNASNGLTVKSQAFKNVRVDVLEIALGTVTLDASALEDTGISIIRFMDDSSELVISAGTLPDGITVYGICTEESESDLAGGF